ncbi:MAG: serine/threonine protein kinase [Planctomycetota bacterium]|nr:MAG: serine/threonine protein kinase [Planctomycetota bacterium]
MPKSRVGPFALETPLSADSASRVYRALHIEQRKLAALRVFSVPMGMTPESRREFAQQLEELKSLRHPNIVRCFGGGFDSRYAYLAYELVDGEALSQLMARRGRLTWETSLDYSRQIAEGLEYCHRLGWVHGRLYPDKILVGIDGRVKINDWRKGVISTVLSTNAAPADMQFLAPELLKGEAPNEKSDLYALGMLMFQMLSGRLPYEQNGEALREAILNDPIRKVSEYALDCPIWLAAIVGQLLEKDPRRRPHGVGAVLLAFREAERRQAEGAGVLQHVAAGFSPIRLDADRGEVEKLLGVKKKKKARDEGDQAPIWERAWFLAVVLACLLGLVVWWLMPPTEDALRRRAERLLPPESDEWIDWNTARDKYLKQIIARFPSGQHTEWARQQWAWVDARDLERKLERDFRRNRTNRWSDAEQQYWQALELEQFGDLQSAAEAYQAIEKLYENVESAASVVYLVREGLQRIAQSDGGENATWEFLQSKLDEAEAAYDQARVLEARQIWESIVRLYANNPPLAPLVDTARQRLEELDRR